ncbi:MAG: carbohydrate ABC transporter permease [Lachnospiraceae bacterium]|nr:carbohydrate ABC transporter permease [Lachnospiraceae bacterium]
MKKKVRVIVIGILAVVFFLPVLLTVLNSFTMQPEVAEPESIALWKPQGVSLVGYYNILVETGWFLKGFWNSVLYAGVTTLLNVLVSIPAAYAFREAEFKGKRALYFFYIVLMMMPLQVTILPNYIGLRDMNLLNTHWAIILPGIFSPFGVFLMCQYMTGIDRSTLEAARLETKSVLQILFHIAVPQVKICIAALFLFVFAENWNLVEQPQVYLKATEKMPLSVLLALGQECDLLSLLAGSVLFMIPIVILYLYFHEHLEAGLGSLKL